MKSPPIYTGHGGMLLVQSPSPPKRPLRHWPHIILDVVTLGLWLPIHLALWYGRR